MVEFSNMRVKNTKKNIITSQILNYRVLIEQDEEGIFVASVPTMQGCYTEGDTYEEAIKNIQDVLQLHLQARARVDTILDDAKTEFVGIKTISIPYGVFAHS